VSRFPSRRIKTPSDLHSFLLNAKVIAVDVASTIGFFWLLVHVLLKELR
jgi:hypothetical protein